MFYAVPRIARNRLYIGDTKGYMHCLDTATGEPVWRYTVSQKGAMVNGTVLANSRDVIFGTNTRAVLSVSAASGVLKWRTRLDSNCTSDAIKLGESVAVHTWDTLYLLDRANGQIQFRWKRKGWRIIGHTAGPRKTSLVLIKVDSAANPECILGSTLPEDRVIGIRNGKVCFDVIAPSFCIGLRYLKKQGLLSVSSDQGITAYNPVNGNLIWEVRVGTSKHGGNQVSIPDVCDETMYFQTMYGYVYAVSLPTGT